MRLALLSLVLVVACARPPGGRDGANGRSCTVTLDGELAVVTCSDGTSARQPDITGDRGDDEVGERGVAGKPGSAALLELTPLRTTADCAAEPGPGCDIDPGCRAGGARVQSAIDGASADGVIGRDDEDHDVTICNPEPPCVDATGEARLPGDLRLRDELDLRRFQLAGCTVIGGRLRVGGDPVTSLFSDMRPLRALEEVEGDLDVSYVVGSLVGLENLRSVLGSLHVHDAIVRELSGLRGLRSVEGDLVIGCGLPLDSAALGSPDAPIHVGGDLRVARAAWAGEIEAVVDGEIRVEECPR